MLPDLPKRLRVPQQARRARSPGGSSLVPILATWLCASVVFLLGVNGIRQGLLTYEGFAWVFQVGSAATAWSLLFLSARSGHLRISNGSLLALAWATVYLLLPSLALLRGNEFLLSHMEYDERVARIFIYHGQYFIGFGLIAALINSRARVVTVEVPVRWSANARMIVCLSLAPVAFDTFVRVLSGDGWFPRVDYADAWTATVDYYSSALAQGGAIRLIAQVQSKLWYAVLVAQGVAVALLLIDARVRPGRRLGNIALIALFFLVLLTFGTTGRSTVMLAGVLAIYIYDRACSRVTWWQISLLAVMAIVIFEFYGYFRTLRSEGFRTAIAGSYASLAEGQGQMGEFLFMLPKTERGLDMFQGDVDPVEYLLHSATGYLPGQIAPWKRQFESTAVSLSVNIIGVDAVSRGSGVAGSIIVDGYRFGGAVGNLLLGAILGALVASIQYLEGAGAHIRRGRISIYRLVLCGAIAVATYNVVRADLPQFVGFIVFYFLAPLFLLGFLFRGHVEKTRVQIRSIL